MHAEGRDRDGRARHLDRRDRGPVLAEVPGSTPHPGTPFLHGRTEPDPLQLADPVRGQEHPGADFAKGWGLLVNRNAEPMGDQGIRGEKAADPAPMITCNRKSAAIRLRTRPETVELLLTP